MGKKLAVWIACGFGLGYSPIASGTVGTLLAFPVVWGMAHLLGRPGGVLWQAVICALLCLVAIPVCHVAEAAYGGKDDGRIVADEYFTFPIAMIGLPFNPWVLLVAFLSCRFFDIVKIPPARNLERLHGGFGIVADDVFASLYSLAANHLVVLFLFPLVGICSSGT